MRRVVVVLGSTSSTWEQVLEALSKPEDAQTPTPGPSSEAQPGTPPAEPKSRPAGKGGGGSKKPR